MRFIEEDNRENITFHLNNEISSDNEIRLIDAFIEKVDLSSHGFVFKTDKGDIDLGGRSEYHPKALAKLYIYGYLNRIRSSRQFAKQCKINIELKWLLGNLQPSHNTINKFRKDNKKAFVELFRTFNSFWKQLGLFGDKDISIDGSFIAAQNSKKNNYSKAKLKKHLDYIDKKTEEYLVLLDASDKEETKSVKKLAKTEIAHKLKVLSERKEKYRVLSDRLADSGELQLSTTDVDARLLSKGHGTQMAYNVQIATEEENKLIAHFEVTNKGDINAFHQVAKACKDFLQDGDETKTINALGDKGYSDGEQIDKCDKDNIVTYIAHKDNIIAKKDARFTKDKFVYDAQQDIYKCPENQVLKTTGKFYKKKKKNVKGYQISFLICQTCPVKEACLNKHNIEKRKGRTIVRSEFEDAKLANKQRVEENKEIYQMRKAMVEHPFGTIKRQWGYNYTLLKGLEKVSCEFALVFAAYNLRRAISILGVKQIINRINQAEMFVFWHFVKKYPLTLNIGQHN